MPFQALDLLADQHGFLNADGLVAGGGDGSGHALAFNGNGYDE